MNHRDIELLMQGVAPAVRNYVAEAQAPLRDETAALEGRLEARLAELARRDTARAAELETLRTKAADAAPALDGRLAEMERRLHERLAEVERQNADRLAEIARAMEGQAAEMRHQHEMRAAEMGALRTRLGDMERRLAEQPVPKDGLPGKDGAPGRDGLPGRDGRDVDPLAVDKTLRDLVGQIPVVGIAGVEVEHDGERQVTLKVALGDGETKAFPIRVPAIIDRGVWREGARYMKGDLVTWGGSAFIAQQDDPPGKPDAEASGFRLAVKRGRDGKPAEMGQRPPAGPVRSPGAAPGEG